MEAIQVVLENLSFGGSDLLPFPDPQPITLSTYIIFLNSTYYHVTFYGVHYV